jgi:tetratricopeptide (TPR) repeat protein
LHDEYVVEGLVDDIASSALKEQKLHAAVDISADRLEVSKAVRVRLQTTLEQARVARRGGRFGQALELHASLLEDPDVDRALDEKGYKADFLCAIAYDALAGAMKLPDGSRRQREVLADAEGWYLRARQANGGATLFFIPWRRSTISAMRGRLEEAVAFAREAIDLYTAHGDKVADAPLNPGILHRNLARHLALSKDLENAIVEGRIAYGLLSADSKVDPVEKVKALNDLLYSLSQCETLRAEAVRPLLEDLPKFPPALMQLPEVLDTVFFIRTRLLTDETPLDQYRDLSLLRNRLLDRVCEVKRDLQSDEVSQVLDHIATFDRLFAEVVKSPKSRMKKRRESTRVHVD